MTPVDGLSVALPWSSVVCTCPDHLRRFVDIFVVVGKTAFTAAAVYSNYLGDRPGSLFTTDFKKGEVFKSDVVATTAAWKEIALTANLVNDAAASELAMYNSTPSMPDIRGWFGRAVSVRELWSKHLLVAAAQLANGLAADLRQITPIYAHYVDESRIVEPLVKKHLLQSKVRQPLSDKLVGLVHVVRLAKGLLAERVASPGAAASTDDSVYSDAEAKGWQDALDAAKKAIEVIAGCVVLYEEKGDAQKKDAANLTAKDRPDMPRALWNALKRACTAPVGPSSKEEPKEAV